MSVVTKGSLKISPTLDMMGGATPSIDNHLQILPSRVTRFKSVVKPLHIVIMYIQSITMLYYVSRFKGQNSRPTTQFFTLHIKGCSFNPASPISNNTGEFA